tara:strand:- start:805 stop:1059 length:255 start_codon:yes stop_codon:yes gene_type:complete
MRLLGSIILLAVTGISIYTGIEGLSVFLVLIFGIGYLIGYYFYRISVYLSNPELRKFRPLVGLYIMGVIFCAICYGVGYGISAI